MSFNLLAAKAVVATNGLATARTLAGFGDDAVGLVARQLDDVATTLGSMTGREAQAAIGARVNFARDAQLLVSRIAGQAAAGTMPGAAGFDDAATAVRRLASSLA